MPERLSNDEFLSSLTNLLSKTHASAHGSVYLTQKPLPTTTTSPPSDPSTEPPQILIRATNGLSKPHRTDSRLRTEKPKVKLSTVVTQEDLEEFYARYAEVCKKGMEGLRKRDKKKGKKGKKKDKGKG